MIFQIHMDYTVYLLCNSGVLISLHVNLEAMCHVPIYIHTNPSLKLETELHKLWAQYPLFITCLYLFEDSYVHQEYNVYIINHATLTLTFAIWMLKPIWTICKESMLVKEIEVDITYLSPVQVTFYWGRLD